MRTHGESGSAVAATLMVVPLLLFLALTLAACGGSDTTASTSPAASPSVTASPSGIPLPTPTVAGTIAFTMRVKDGDDDVCVVNTDGTGLETLAGGTGCQQCPRWSPDGKRITYFESAPGEQDPQQVWVMNADGSGLSTPRELGSGPGQYWMYESEPSPDGNFVVRHDVETDRLVVVPVDSGGSPVVLLDPVADYTEGGTIYAAWSPDGTAVAIAGYEETPFTRLCVVNADGTGLSAVPGIDAAREPVWQPE